MQTITVNVLSTSVPAAQSASAANQAGLSQPGGQSSDVTNASGNAQTSSAPSTGNDTTQAPASSGQQDGGFRTLLSTQGATTTPSANNAASNTDVSNQTVDTKATGTGGDTSISAIVANLLLSQMQTGATADTGASASSATSAATTAQAQPTTTGAALLLLASLSNDASSAATQTATPSTAPRSDAALLQQLQAMLQQLASGQAGTNPSANNSAAGATATQVTASSSALVSVTANQPAASSGTAADLTQALSIVATLLQQVTQTLQPAAAATPSSAQDSGDDTAGVVGTDASSSHTPSAAALLSQLSNLLNQKLSTLTAGQNQNTATANAGTASTGNVKFDDILSALNQSTTSKDIAANVQAAISQVVDILTTPHDSKSTDSSDSSVLSAQQASNAAQAGAYTASTGAPSASQTKNLSAATQATSVADQVIVQIKNLAASNNSQIKIQLEPAELGKVEVSMAMNASTGKLDINITADSRQTLSMLQSEARALEASLRDIGLKTGSGSLSFNLRGDGQQGQQSGNNTKNGYTQVAAIGSTDDDTDYYTAAIGVYQLSAQQGLDIRV